MTAQDPAARAIARLLAIRDELELVGRPPGERLTITRQQLDAAIDDLGVAARLIREREERARLSGKII
jgi:hypothetical protein